MATTFLAADSNGSGEDVATYDEATELKSHCDAASFTDFYGLLVQTILAALAFTSLVIKRFLEPKDQRRPWSTWFLDTSKQAAGMALIHALNVFLAPMFRGDPCTWYVISFLLDSTLGLLIIYVGVRVTTGLASRRKWSTLKFGEYNSAAPCRAWFHQCAAFSLIILVEKLAVTLLMTMDVWTNVRRRILAPIKNPKVELTLVMLVIPFFVNSLIFWCVDNFTMKKLFKAEKPTAKRRRRSSEDLLEEKLLKEDGLV